MKEGFEPNAGGSGAAKHSGDTRFQDQSKGKVHFTKQRSLAGFFAGYTEHGQFHPNASHGTNTLKGLINSLNPLGNSGKIIKARVSDRAYKEFEVDPHTGGVNKDKASTIDKRVSPASIVGHKDNRGIRQFLSRRHLSDYYSDTKGKVRGLKGAAAGLVGAGLIGHAILQRHDDDK